jgi:hypothetical protein
MVDVPETVSKRLAAALGRREQCTAPLVAVSAIRDRDIRS